MDFADTTNSCQKKYFILRSKLKQVGEKHNYLFIAMSVPNWDVNKLAPWLRWLLLFDKIESAPPRKWPLVSAWAHNLVGTGTWAQSRSCNHNWQYQIWRIESSSKMCWLLGSLPFLRSVLSTPLISLTFGVPKMCWLLGSLFLAQCTVYPGYPLIWFDRPGGRLSLLALTWPSPDPPACLFSNLYNVWQFVRKTGDGVKSGLGWDRTLLEWKLDAGSGPGVPVSDSSQATRLRTRLNHI